MGNKRQRERIKRQKREDKAARKAQRKAQSGDEPEAPGEPSDEEPSDEEPSDEEGAAPSSEAAGETTERPDAGLR
jgi:hypothetical protein